MDSTMFLMLLLGFTIFFFIGFYFWLKRKVHRHCVFLIRQLWKIAFPENWSEFV